MADNRLNDEKAIKYMDRRTLQQIAASNYFEPWRPGINGLNAWELYRECIAVVEENNAPVALVFSVYIYRSYRTQIKQKITTAVSIPIAVANKFMSMGSKSDMKQGKTNGDYSNVYFQNGILKFRNLNEKMPEPICAESTADLEHKFFGDCKSGKVHKSNSNNSKSSVLHNLDHFYKHDNLLHINTSAKDIMLPVFELSCILKNSWGTHFNGTMLMPKANGKAHWAITDFDNAMFKFITKGKWFDGVSVKGSKLNNETQKLDNYYADKVIIGRDYQGGGADIDEKMVVAMGEGFECPPYIFKAFRNLYSNYELLMQSAEDASKTPVPFLIHINWEHIMTKEKAIRYAQSRIEQEQKLGIPFGLTLEQAYAEIDTFDYITEAYAVEIQKNVDRFNSIMIRRYQSGDYDKYYGYSKSKQRRKKLIDKIFKK